MRRSTQVHSTVSEMVLRQRTEIRLDDPFSQIFSQFCMLIVKSIAEPNCLQTQSIVKMWTKKLSS
jgi:hypothetical protein